MSRPLAIRLALALLTLGIFSPALSGEMLNWDDPHYLEANPSAQRLDVVGIFGQQVAANYQPLSVLSLAIEHRLFGLEPIVFHLTNLLLHIVNRLLVLGFVERLRPGDRVVPALCALFFAIHPLHVESVAWIAERKDVLSVLLYLLTLLGWLRFRDSAAGRHYGLTLGAFALALLAKPMAVTAPAVLLALDWRAGRRGLRPLAELAPFLVLAAAAGVANLVIQAPLAPQALAIYGYSPLGRLWLGLESLVFYVSKTLLPVGLSAVYDIALVRVLPSQWALAGAAAAALAVWAWRTPAGRRDALFALFFFLVTIAPVLKIVPFGANSLFNDRYLYLPSVGLFMLFALPFRGVLGWRPLQRSAVLGAGLALTFVWCAQTYQRCGVWRSSESLWLDVLAKYPEATTALNNLGRHYFDTEGETEQSLALFRRAVASRPESHESWFNLGLVHHARGEREAAELHYERSLELWGDSLPNRLAIAKFYVEDGELAKAAAHYRAAIETPPERAELHHNLGDLYLAMGQTGRARQAYEEALRLEPDLAPTWVALAHLHADQGNERKALELYEEAAARGAPVDAAELSRLRQKFR